MSPGNSPSARNFSMRPATGSAMPRLEMKAVEGHRPSSVVPHCGTEGGQSKTLARLPMASEPREASWTAPALPPSRRARAPLRRDGGWRFSSANQQAGRKKLLVAGRAETK
jgi:hypothetical protein